LGKRRREQAAEAEGEFWARLGQTVEADSRAILGSRERLNSGHIQQTSGG
jgi:hypothetical protein